MLAAAVSSVRELLGLDWSQSATFDRLMSRVLFIAIGLELARMLVVHSLRAILEMLAFAIARNMLLPDRTALDIVLGAVGFAVLLAAARHFLAREKRAARGGRHRHTPLTRARPRATAQAWPTSCSTWNTLANRLARICLPYCVSER